MAPDSWNGNGAETPLIMLNILIVVVMLGILISLGFGLYFLVRDKDESNRMVISLSIRVGLAVLMLALLGYGFMTRFLI
jgi:hypothetical protein